MKRLVFAYIFSILICSTACASILIQSPDGKITTKTSLAEAVVAPDAAGKTIVVNSALSASFSNISSATVHAWPSDRKLKFEKGGSIANTTKFQINSPFEADLNKVFNGTGAVIFGAGSVTEILPEWWGCKVGGTPDENYSALIKVVACAKASKLNIYHSAVGTYQIRLYYPIRQNTVSSVLDYSGIIVRGTGKNTIIETVLPSGTGCDVFQFNGVANVTVKDIGIHSIITVFTGSGSNAVSITNGSYGINLKNVYAYVMPYTQKSSYLDGGAAFTIQATTSLPVHDITVEDCTAIGGSYGIAYQGSSKALTPAGAAYNIRFIHNTVTGFYTGIRISSGFGMVAEKALSNQNFVVMGNRVIDCQHGINLGGSTNCNCIGNEVNSSLTDNKDPFTGSAWLPNDTILNGLSALTMFDSHITYNIVYEKICTNYFLFGGGYSGKANTPSRNSYFIGNTASGFASGYGIASSTASGYGYVLDCVILNNTTNGALRGNIVDILAKVSQHSI
jgi:hypothetical protein